MNELIFLLSKIRRRYRLLDAASLAQRTLWLPAAGMLLLQLAGRFLPIENLLLLSLAPLALWLLILPLTSLLRRFSLARAARRVDEDLGLYERIFTALELQQAHPAPGYDFPSTLVEKQHADALQAARAVNPHRDLPMAWLRRPLLAALTLAVLAATAAFLPNPMDAVLEQRRAVARAAAEQAERIETLQEELAENPALTPEERQELARQLEELAAQLRANPGDLEQALADLARMEQTLAERSDPNTTARQANLENLSQRLQSLAGIQADPQQAASESASQALAELATQLAEQLDTVDPQERPSAGQLDALAAELGALSAQAALSGDPQLSQALSSLAQAVQASNSQAVQSSAQQAQQALQQTAQQLSAQQALQQALQQLQQSRQALAQAGQNAARANQGQNAGQPGSPGQNPGQGQTGAPGSSPGNTPGSGQVSGGGGSQANTLPPASSSGQAGRPQGNRPGATGELGEQVFAPWLRPAANGEELFIPGQDSNQGQTTSAEGSSPTLGAGSQALTPYYDVYYQYFNAANQAIQQGAIPASLADYVREYFSQLEP